MSKKQEQPRQPRKWMRAPWPHGRDGLRLMNSYEAQHYNSPEIHERSWTFGYDDGVGIRSDRSGDFAEVSCNHRGEPELDRLLLAVQSAERDAVLLRRAYEALFDQDERERAALAKATA